MALSASIDFLVDDGSPTIAYSPFGDTLSAPNLNAGWNPYFTGSGFASALGDIGNGTNYHATALNGATLTISWQGTGIQLSGQANNISFITTLDGNTTSSPGFDASLNILAAFRDLPRSNHSVTLQVVTSGSPSIPPTSGLYFDSALITASPPTDDLSNVAFTNRPLDVNNIAFLGRWSFTEATSGSFYSSVTKGDRVRTRFQGTSLQLFGATSPRSGLYSVTLDNVTTTLSARSSFTNGNTLLYFATGLSLDAFHDVEVENLDSSLTIGSSGFLVGVPEDSSSLPVPPSLPSNSPGVEPDNSVSFSRGAIAALALGGVLAFLLLTGILYYFFVYRRRRRRQYVAGQREPPEKVRDLPGVVDITQELIPDPRAYATSGGRGRWRADIESGKRSLRNLGAAFRSSPTAEEGKVEGVIDNASDARGSDIPGRSDSSRAKGIGVPIVPIFKRGSNRTQSSWSSSFAIDLGFGSNSRSDCGIGQPGVPQSPLSLTAELAALSNTSSPITAPPDTNRGGSGSRLTRAAIMGSAPHTVPLPQRSPTHARGGSRVPLLQYHDNDHEPPYTSAGPYNPYAALSGSNPDSELMFSMTDTSLGGTVVTTGHEGPGSAHALPTIAEPIQPPPSQEVKRPIRKLPDIPVAKTTSTTTPAPATLATAPLIPVPVDPPSTAATLSHTTSPPQTSSSTGPPPRSIFRLTPPSILPPPHPPREDSIGDQSFDNSTYPSRSNTTSTNADSRHRPSASTGLAHSFSYLSYVHGRRAQGQSATSPGLSMRLSAVPPPPSPPSPPPVSEMPAHSSTSHGSPQYATAQAQQQQQRPPQQSVPESPDHDVSPLSLFGGYPQPPFLQTRFSQGNFGFMEVDGFLSTTTSDHPPYQFPLPPPLRQTPSQQRLVQQQQQQSGQQLQNQQQQRQNQQVAQQEPPTTTTESFDMYNEIVSTYTCLDADVFARNRTTGRDQSGR